MDAKDPIKEKITFKKLVKNSLDGIVVVDDKGTIIYGNQSAKEIFGRKNIIGTDFGIPCKEDEMIEVKIPGSKKENFKYAEIKSARTVLDGEKVYIVNIRDITPRKEAQKEYKKYQKLLEKNEKKVLMGKMAGGMAHEINNPLTTVLAISQLLLEEASCQKNREDLMALKKNAQRISTTVKSFLSFSKDRDYVYKKVKLGKIIDNSLKFLDKERKEEIKIVKKYGSDSPVVKTSRFHLEEVLTNLIKNAMESMENSSEKVLTLRTEENDDRVLIFVKDTGCGIDEEDFEKIFEPYCTTKGKKGTGLGLPTCKDIMEKLGGGIFVKSKGKNKGSEFVVKLPKKKGNVENQV
ncbi:MAG: PAS domain-containing sensor histidine kinase [Elusimicrobiota bacterium]